MVDDGRIGFVGTGGWFNSPGRRRRCMAVRNTPAMVASRNPQADRPPLFDPPTAAGKLTEGLPEGVVQDLLEETAQKLPWDTTSAGILNVSYHNLQQRYQQKRKMILAKAYRECQRITSLYAKTFYLGTSFLSKAKRLPVWSIYVWCRRTDDIVDGPRALGNVEAVNETLDAWEQRLADAFEGKAHDALDMTLVDVIEKYPLLDPQPFYDMIEGMRMDLTKFRYETWDELYTYCYRVASTVGLMTLPIMGTSKPGPEAYQEAIEPAVALGIALQITNILRDVGEDRYRGRVYLPQEDLRRFNYTEKELFEGVVNKNYIELMKFEVERARHYFNVAEEGIAMLAPDARLPVRASMDIYSGILNRLEMNGYDNFSKRAYVPKIDKMMTLPLCWLRVQEGVIGQFYKRWLS